MSDYYSETNEWSKAGAKLWARLWSATTFRQFHRKFHFAWKQNLKVLVAARNLQINKTFLTLELSQYSKRNSTFSSRAWESVPASSNCSLQPTRKHQCLCMPVWPAQAVQERCHKSLAFDFAVKTFDCSSGIAFGSNCQMIGRGLNLDSNLNSAPDQLVVKVLSALMCLNNLCGVWILFTGLLKMQQCRNWGQWWVYISPHPPDSADFLPHHHNYHQKLKSFFNNKWWGAPLNSQKGRRISSLLIWLCIFALNIWLK